MTKKLILYFILFCAVAGCKTDFDVIAPYQEVMVVYGLINPTDSVQVVRIEKAYLGEGNALIMAQQADSINYPDILDVKLERILNGSVMETFDLNRVQLSKDTGDFARDPHFVYQTPSANFNHPGEFYHLTILNTQTGVSAESTTRMLQDVHVSTPPAVLDSITLAGLQSFKPAIDYAAGVAITDLVFRFHYREIDPSGVSTFRSVDMNFNEQVTAPNQQGTSTFEFKKDDFFKLVADHIQQRPGYTYRLDSLDVSRPFEFIFMTGSEDLRTYIQLQQPTTGVVQERPFFTTVTNGLGIFSSRVIHSNFNFASGLTEQAFDTSRFTRNLGFQFD